MSALRPLLLALCLVGIGFVVGYGFQARGARPVVSVAPAPTPQAPLVKGLHASPDGKLLAFTGVYARSERAGVWILNATTGTATQRESPAGWQDFVTQWRSDGSALLLERERIPRPVASASAGLYQAPVERNTAQNGLSQTGELEPLAEDVAPRGERIITGLLTPNGELVIKTRREPKALYVVRDGIALPIDRAGVTYGQNRPVREGGKLVFYVVRDMPGDASKVALFRVESGRARQISAPWEDVEWSYVAPSGKQIIVARQSEEGEDWNWTLYGIGPTGLKTLKTASIPADVISVYWSPDEKRVLGAAGDKLWLIDVPTLQVHQLGSKTDWNADDATWIGNEQIAVAESGEIWRVNVKSAQATRLWRFPEPFWK